MSRSSLSKQNARRVRRAGRNAARSARSGSASPGQPRSTPSLRQQSARSSEPILMSTSLEEANTARLVAGLRENMLDAVFLRSEALEGDDLELRPISDEPMLVVLPASHPAARSAQEDLIRLRDDARILTPRGVGQTLFDTVISTCRQAGFEPVLGQLAPQLGSVINLVAAVLGLSIVPASMRQLRVTGFAYREDKGMTPIAKLALALSRVETTGIVRT